MNAEGRVQQAFQAVHPVGLAKEDWKIIRAIAEQSGVHLPYNTHEELRAVMPHYVLDMIEPAPWAEVKGDTNFKAGAITRAPHNFYETCAISRNSENMKACTARFVAGETKEAA
jgi:NADH dehydrogenase/NADH:ubiquinone oxidoreductase subunit G